MDESRFNKMLGKISAKFGVEGEEFAGKIEELIELLNEGDSEDCFGSEGWRHCVGWD